MISALSLLQKYWNHQTFRKPQEEIINAVIENRDVFALLPTGAGKSACYQIPALINDGVCIVISPLIALMEDQVNSLQKKGIKAIALHSKYNFHETIQAFDNLRFGNYKFLYLSPEKLESEIIQEKIKQLNVNLIAVDEAHCISQWGHDFRPAYLKISILKKIHPQTNIIALTASATPKVINDIIEHLQLDDLKLFKRSFYRENLTITVSKSENILDRIRHILVRISEPVIIYVKTRKRSINISNYLNANGFKSGFYHGGMQNDEKMASMNNWLTEHLPIMVATNAFGMGIDKSNVRLVIHTDIPNSIENYLQEIGRAGRDGVNSYAYLIYNDSSIFESMNYLKKGIANTKFCKKVYFNLHQNYQIVQGEFSEKFHPFNLQDFCSKYNLPLLRTFHALNTFEIENIIETQQSINKKSSLKIIVSNSYLFSYEERNPKLEATLKVILRNYGGTFDQLIPINESFIARKLNIPKSEIVLQLHQLEKDGIILYKPSVNDTLIKFLVAREDNFILNKISKNIENTNKTKIRKLEAIIDYITDETICRNIKLLHYFGEKNLTKCNSCDVCLSHKRRNEKIDYFDISNAILKLFKDEPLLSSMEIIDQFQFDKNIILKTLQLLIEKNTLRLTSQNNFEMVKK